MGQEGKHAISTLTAGQFKFTLAEPCANNVITSVWAVAASAPHSFIELLCSDKEKAEVTGFFFPNWKMKIYIYISYCHPTYNINAFHTLTPRRCTMPLSSHATTPPKSQDQVAILLTSNMNNALTLLDMGSRCNRCQKIALPER